MDYWRGTLWTSLGLLGFAALLYALIWWLTTPSGPCVGWEPDGHVYRLTPSGERVAQQRWRCVERER